MQALGLTPQEKAELDARPMGDPKWRGLTDAQIAIRIEIGKKMQAYFNRVDPTMTDRFKAIYEKMPMWAFYEDAESETGWPPRRAYGVCFGEDGEERLQTATLMPCINNRTIGGCPVNCLKRVDRWSPHTLEQMKCGLYQGIGIWEDPLGFFTLLMEVAE